MLMLKSIFVWGCWHDTFVFDASRCGLCLTYFNMVTLLTSIRQLAMSLRDQLPMLFQTHSQTWSAWSQDHVRFLSASCYRDWQGFWSLLSSYYFNLIRASFIVRSSHPSTACAVQKNPRWKTCRIWQLTPFQRARYPQKNPEMQIPKSITARNNKAKNSILMLI